MLFLYRCTENKMTSLPPHLSQVLSRHRRTILREISGKVNSKRTNRMVILAPRHDERLHLKTWKCNLESLRIFSKGNHQMTLPMDLDLYLDHSLLRPTKVPSILENQQNNERSLLQNNCLQSMTSWQTRHHHQALNVHQQSQLLPQE